jgi:hypothetical protein
MQARLDFRSQLQDTSVDIQPLPCDPVERGRTQAATLLGAAGDLDLPFPSVRRPFSEVQFETLKYFRPSPLTRSAPEAGTSSWQVTVAPLISVPEQRELELAISMLDYEMRQQLSKVPVCR